MFCSKCGTKLSDDALFCVECGNKVKEIAENEQGMHVSPADGTPNTIHKVNAEGNAGVTKNFDNLNIENVFSERINSEIFDDRASQNKLFSLYSSLVPVVKKIEDQTSKLQEMNEEIKHLKDKSEVPFGWGPKIVKAVTIIVLIFQFFDKGLDKISYPILTTLVNPLLAAIEDWFWLIKIPAFLILTLGVGVLITPIIMGTIAWIIWFIYFKLIRFKVVYRKRLGEAAILEKKCQELEKEREKTCLSITEEIKYVPKTYRTSHALSYFVEMYNNSRVDSLKEAVNMYVKDSLAQEQLKSIQELTKVSIATLWNIEEIAAKETGIVHDINEVEEAWNSVYEN